MVAWACFYDITMPCLGLNTYSFWGFFVLFVFLLAFFQNNGGNFAPLGLIALTQVTIIKKSEINAREYRIKQLKQIRSK